MFQIYKLTRNLKARRIYALANLKGAPPEVVLDCAAGCREACISGATMEITWVGWWVSPWPPSLQVAPCSCTRISLFSSASDGHSCRCSRLCWQHETQLEYAVASSNNSQPQKTLKAWKGHVNAAEAARNADELVPYTSVAPNHLAGHDGCKGRLQTCGVGVPSSTTQMTERLLT